jgi:hypothetical protein
VALVRPTLPPYDVHEWRQKPFPERARMVCESWAMQGYGTPLVIHLAYLVKILLVYIGPWLLWCTLTPGLALAQIGDWWLHPIAFQKAIVWSMTFEVLGLGCGSGPLTGRYWPPFGGFLHFLRPGTTKLPLIAKLGHRRTTLDVLVYASLLAVAVWTLASPAPSREQCIALLALLAVLGVTDKTIFLAARSEHYGTTLLVFVLAPSWIAGAQAVQLALWFWAGFSKLNHHFPTVVGVMNSNSPFVPGTWWKRRMYRDFPEDMRPSRLAGALAHGGTALEFAVPLVLGLTAILAPGGPWLLVGMVLMVGLHLYITSNIPMGVPLEWNVMVVYGGFALFWAHPEVSILELGATPLLAALLAVLLVGIPLLGNLVPSATSFLPAMRYYAGNWACSVWLFRGDSYRKLERLTKSARWIDEQLAPIYDPTTIMAVFSKVISFRLMHLHGRCFPALLPTAVGSLERVGDYEWIDGEIVAGLALGWNFGDGHLHDERLLAAIQAQCEFEPGELRCIFVESQPFARPHHDWRVSDAATGTIAAGRVSVAELRERQPWG